MSNLSISLLGDFRLQSGGRKSRDLTGQKDRALLTYLAMSPGVSHERERLAGLLWGDHGETQARDSLKHALARLRKCLNAGELAPIVANRNAVSFDASGLDVDVLEFEALATEKSAEARQALLALYRGDLLQNTTVHDPAFDDWLLMERQRLRQMAEEGAGALMTELEARGDFEEAAAAARRLLQLDPLREDATRCLMRVHARADERNQALKVYAALSDQLDRDLGTEPERETAQLCEQIRSGTYVPADLTPVGASPPEAARPLLLPGRPSIAVLAFENMSGDPDQDYFADGIVEEITTALSRVRSLFVIARNSSFSYKGQPIDVKRIGRELGVRYVVEGSLRTAARQIRIMSRLVDASDRSLIWAERFQGEVEDLFDLQDQIASQIVGAILPKLEQAEIARALHKPTSSLDAYDQFLRALAAFHTWTRDGNFAAMKLFYAAIDLDPAYAAAYGMAARTLSQRKACGWSVDRAQEAEEATYLAGKAVECGPDDALALSTAGIGLGFVANRPAAGIRLVERALDINPNLAMAWLLGGWMSCWLGKPERAIEQLERAMRLSPNDPQFPMMQTAMALAFFFSDRNEEAQQWAERASQRQPNYMIAHCILAASRAVAGMEDAARRSMSRVREIDTGLRVSNLLEAYPISRKQDVDLWISALRRAGLPE